jgi:hypothetical protein
MKEELEKKIIEAIEFIKENSPKLHLYITAKLLERSERGTSRIKTIEARRILGSIFHISRDSQLKILRELEEYRLILRINKKEYLIPITKEGYEKIFNRQLNI